MEQWAERVLQYSFQKWEEEDIELVARYDHRWGQTAMRQIGF